MQSPFSENEVGTITLATTLTDIPACANGMAGIGRAALGNGTEAKVINESGVTVGRDKRVELRWSPKEVWEIVRSEP